MRHCTLAFVVCLLAAPVQGQSPLQLGLGQRIWVRSAVVPGTLDVGVQGTLEGVSGDSLHLRLSPGDPAVSVFVSRDGTAAAAGLFLGGVGLVGGLAIGALKSHDTWTRIGWKSAARPVISSSPHGVGLGLSLPI